jgi:hypothetical protein
MLPREFKGANVIMGGKQAQYKPLPAHRTNDGTLITCWKLTFADKIKILLTGDIWVLVKTFSRPLQPMILLAEFESKIMTKKKDLDK